MQSEDTKLRLEEEVRELKIERARADDKLREAASKVSEMSGALAKLEKQRELDLGKIDHQFKLVEKMVSFGVIDGTHQIQKNQDFIEIREMVEQIVGPTCKRSIELQTVVGELLEKEHNLEQRFTQLEAYAEQALDMGKGTLKAQLVQKQKVFEARIENKLGQYETHHDIVTKGLEERMKMTQNISIDAKRDYNQVQKMLEQLEEKQDLFSANFERRIESQIQKMVDLRTEFLQKLADTNEVLEGQQRTQEAF